MPKYVSYDEMVEILDNKYLLPFRKDERLRGLNGIDIVRCKDCKYIGKVGDLIVCRIHEISTHADDYCSSGERSEE